MSVCEEHEKKFDYCTVLVRETLSEQHACETVNYGLRSLEEWSSDKLLGHRYARACAWDDPVASMRGPGLLVCTGAKRSSHQR
jgi:hypothetical protein